MSDDKNNPGPADRQRINVNEDYELRFWTSELGISADELRRAVAEVGVMATDVRAYLARKR